MTTFSSEQASTEPPKTWRRSQLTLMYAVLSAVGIIIDLKVQPYYKAKEDAGLLTLDQQHLLHNFLHHVGDVSDMTLWPLVALTIESGFISLAQKHPTAWLETTIQWLDQYLAKILLTFSLIALFIAENPFGIEVYGQPHLSDIPAGLFGIVASGLMYDWLKSVIWPQFAHSLESEVVTELQISSSGDLAEA